MPNMMKPIAVAVATYYGLQYIFGIPIGTALTLSFIGWAASSYFWRYD